MIINTNYRMGSFVDLCRCPCYGSWQTSCPPFNCNCPYPDCFNPCPPQFSQPCERPCNNSCSYSNFCLPQNLLFFFAGYLSNKRK